MCYGEVLVVQRTLKAVDGAGQLWPDGSGKLSSRPPRLTVHHEMSLLNLEIDWRHTWLILT